MLLKVVQLLNYSFYPLLTEKSVNEKIPNIHVTELSFILLDTLRMSEKEGCLAAEPDPGVDQPECNSEGVHDHFPLGALFILVLQ